MNDIEATGMSRDDVERMVRNEGELRILELKIDGVQTDVRDMKAEMVKRLDQAAAQSIVAWVNSNPKFSWPLGILVVSRLFGIDLKDVLAVMTSVAQALAQ